MPTPTLIDDARAITARYLGGYGSYLDVIPYVANFRSLLETLETAERQAGVARDNLLALVGNQAATSKDFRDFETLRLNLYRAQLRLRTEILVYIPTQYRDQIPTPLALNPVTPNSIQTRGVGLGNPVLLWAAGVIAVLIALGLIYLIAQQVTQSAETIAQVGTAWANSRQYEQLTRSRLEAYRACIATGSSSEQCTVLAVQTVPTPEASFATVSSTSSKLFWTLALVTSVAVTGTLGYYYWKRGGKLSYA